MATIGYVRISLLFTLFLAFAVALLGYIFIIGDRNLENRSGWINRSYNIIHHAKDISTLTEGMLASQRGFILTGSESFMNEVVRNKQLLDEKLDKLEAATQDNAAQTERIVTLRQEIESMTALLHTAAREALENRYPVAANTANLNRLRQTILAINADLLTEEQNLLNSRIQAIEQKKQQYYETIAIGGALTVVFVFLFNIAGLHLLERKAAAEKSLKSTEDRFMLAVEGTNDGIFDWDLINDEIFYSRQFFRMLGYDRAAYTGSSKDFRDLIHPEDEPRVWEYIERYLRQEIEDYAHTFRLRHAAGRWVWVNSRAKGIFDSTGRPLRLVGANTDITQAKEYQKRLRDEKRRAEESSRAKSDFLAHMSHEIRTPLTAISGIAEIFQQDLTSLDDKQRNLVQTLHSSTVTLKDLVNDILDFSRIESGELELEKETFSLESILDQIVAMMSVNALRRQLDFQFEGDSIRGKLFYGDPLRLRQVLINLVGNAVKFTPSGEVTLTAQEYIIDGDKFLRLDIQDTGIGIAPEHQDMIFERFKQADTSVSRKYGGTGLGLPISRNLVELMGGTLTLESHEGKGSTFTVMLPWREAATEQKSPPVKSLNKARKQKTSKASRARVLLIEDYEGNIVVIGHLLQELGCAYDVARNGIEGLELWRKNTYDVLLMDVQMPEMDGFTATAEIRRLEKEKKLGHTPIIGMTAHALVGDKAKCIEAGMDAYLPKPIVEADLRHEILRYIKKGAA